MRRLGQGPIEADVGVLRVLLGKCGLAQPGGWLPFAVYGALPGGPMTANCRPFAATVPRALVVVSWNQRVNPQSPNDGSNYWQITLTGDQTGLLATLTTSGITPNTSTLLAASDLNVTLDPAENWLRIDAAKVGSPGSLYMSAPCLFVI